MPGTRPEGTNMVRGGFVFRFTGFDFRGIPVRFSFTQGSDSKIQMNLPFAKKNVILNFIQFTFLDNFRFFDLERGMND